MSSKRLHLVNESPGIIYNLLGAPWQGEYDRQGSNAVITSLVHLLRGLKIFVHEALAVGLLATLALAMRLGRPLGSKPFEDLLALEPVELVDAPAIHDSKETDDHPSTQISGCTQSNGMQICPFPASAHQHSLLRFCLPLGPSQQQLKFYLSTSSFGHLVLDQTASRVSSAALLSRFFAKSPPAACLSASRARAPHQTR